MALPSHAARARLARARADQVDGKRLLVFGGLDKRSRYNDAWLFNVERREWTALKLAGPCPEPRAHFTATRIGDRVLVFGGYGGCGAVFNDLWALHVGGPDASAFRWEDLTPALQGAGPSPRFDHAACAYPFATDGAARERLVVSGGRDLSTMLQDSHVLDVASLTWLPGGAPAPSEACNCVCEGVPSVPHHKVFSFGGKRSMLSYTNAVEVMDCGAQAWASPPLVDATKAPCGRCACGALRAVSPLAAGAAAARAPRPAPGPPTPADGAARARAQLHRAGRTPRGRTTRAPAASSYLAAGRAAGWATCCAWTCRPSSARRTPARVRAAQPAGARGARARCCGCGRPGSTRPHPPTPDPAHCVRARTRRAGISPGSGPVFGETPMTIKGLLFPPGRASVRFGTSEKNFVVVEGEVLDGQTIACRTPSYQAFGAAAVDVRVDINGAGWTVDTGRFAYFANTGARPRGGGGAGSRAAHTACARAPRHRPDALP